MKEREWKTTFSIYDSPGELNHADRDLLEAAVKACDSAWAPYSGFRVGAAVLLENGQVVTGSNQENAAYPSGLCAERVALFAAGSRFPGHKILAIAVTALKAESGTRHPVTPCGACRQVMLEYEQRYGSDIRLIMLPDHHSILISGSAKNLMPLAFNAESM